MSELRFACPACGQHVECEKQYGGHVIHCPKCCAELRIPFANTALPSEMSVQKAQLVDPSSAKPPTDPAAEPSREFVCPVCKSDLRAPVHTTAHAENGLPTAELVRQAPEPGKKEPSVSEDKSPKEDEPPKPEPHTHKSHTEHEQEIAAARAARPIQLYPTTKPRLDVILSNAHTPSPEPPSGGSDKETKPPPDDHKTIQE
jgi:hypothetical protein